MRIISVTHCSGMKSTPAVFFPKKAYKTLDDFWASWVSDLELPCAKLPAVSLYTGKGFKRLSSQVRPENFFIASAGLGLIQSMEHVPSYSLTISPGHEVSLQNFVDERVDPVSWWQKIAKNNYSFPDLESIASSEDILLVSLTSAYVRMLAKQLLSFSGRLMIFTGDHSVLASCGLGSKSSPYTSVFDGPDCPLPGTKSDFAQRIHSDFITRLNVTENDFELAKKSVQGDMKTWIAPEIKNNQRLSDVEILNLIKKHREKFTSIGLLHRFFRNELSIACEQKRFSNLYRQSLEEEKCQAI